MTVGWLFLVLADSLLTGLGGLVLFGCASINGCESCDTVITSISIGLGCGLCIELSIASGRKEVTAGICSFDNAQAMAK